MTPIEVAVLSIVVLLVLMMSGMPVGFTFIVVGIPGIIYLGGLGSALSVLGQMPYTWGSNYILITVPLFVLMGYFAYESGVSSDLFKTAYSWLGHMPGGLAIATMGACAGFAACTGSTVACAAAMGAIALPEMKKYGYDDKLATGTVAAGGTLGILIPPSTTAIIYGFLTNQSIGKLFVAGILPGIFMATFFMVAIYLRCKRNPVLAPPGPQTTWSEKIGSLRGVWGMLLLFTLVIGGIWFGVFTATEAAAIGAFGSFVIVGGRRKLTRKNMTDTLMKTMRTTSMVMWIIIGAMIYSYFMAITRLPMDLSSFVAGLPVSRWIILIGILLVYIPAGMFMDSLSVIVLTVPIFFPVVTSLGFDPIWFGTLVTVLAELGVLTPPMGLNCFVVAGVAKDVPLSIVFKGVMFFCFLFIPVLAILVGFPQITLWLPSMMY